MPLNIETAESAFLGGFAKFEGWRKRFEGGWYAPIGEMQRALLLQSLPEPVKGELRRRVPGGMAVLEGDGRRRTGDGGREMEDGRRRTGDGRWGGQSNQGLLF